MTDTQRKAILAEVAQYSEPPALQAHEVTAADYAAEFGIRHQLAAMRLKALVEQGRMIERRGVYDPRVGKVVNGYSLVSHSEPCGALSSKGLE